MNGDSALNSVECCGRLTSSMRITPTSMRVLDMAGLGAAHQQADLLERRLGARQRLRQLAIVHDGDRVGDLEQLVEILADDQHRRAAARQFDQRLPDAAPQRPHRRPRSAG